LDKFNKEEEAEKAKDFIKNNKINKDKTILLSYLKGFGNIQSIVGAVFSKDIAAKYNMELNEFYWKNAVLQRQKNLAEDLKTVLSIDEKQLADYNQYLDKDSFTSIRDKENNEKFLSKGAVLDLYEVMKNPDLATAIYRDYEEKDINNAPELLNDFDKQYADTIKEYLPLLLLNKNQTTPVALMLIHYLDCRSF
jgi:hypothetical protein